MAADEAGRNSIEQPDAPGRVATKLDETSGLPSGVECYIEACSRLAAEAAALGDMERARDLLQMGVDAVRMLRP